LIGLSNGLKVKLLAQTVKKLWAFKVGGQKNPRPFGFEATFLATLCSESLLSERPGFDPRPAQSLGAYTFAAFWPTWLKMSFFERSNLYLLI